MQNNEEMKQYYLDKEVKAQKELTLLREANGFEITQDKVDVINQAADQMDKMGDFSDWCEMNFEGTNVEKCYNVFEEYVNSVDHIMPVIDEIMKTNSIE